MGTDAGFSGLEQEDDMERRRTEDEENTLRKTQKVSIYFRTITIEWIGAGVQLCRNETGH